MPRFFSANRVENIVKKTKKKQAVVCCQGGAEPRSAIDHNSLTGDCGQIAAAHPTGIYECIYGCLGGGSCVAVCEFEAITLNPQRIAQVDRELCTGCGLCVKACPQKIIRLVLPENSISPRCSSLEAAKPAKKQCSHSCIACRICEKNCPAEAISVLDERAVIDQERCIACGLCAVKCPRGVIVDADGIFTPV